MSTALAIASVTHVLKDLLNNGLIDHDITGIMGGNVLVTAVAPDRIDTSANELSQLNLFMYLVTANTGWNAQGMPSLNNNGNRISNPPLALDLHYLLSAYGAVELHTEILLGYGMQLLHENPVLSKNAIQNSLSPPLNVSGNDLPARLKSLSTSELADQVEQIKITPQPLNLDEISKLWSAFQAKYRPSSAYKITVVLIESKKSVKAALPVQARNMYVLPFRKAEISKLMSQRTDTDSILEDQKILAGYNLIIHGTQLKAENVYVQIDQFKIIPDYAKIKDTLISVKLPDTLQAGIHGVQVLNELMMGTPEQLHKGFSSNSAAFILCPFIAAISISNVLGSGNSLRSADLVLDIEPGLGEDQKVNLFLNENTSDISREPYFYSFQEFIKIAASPYVPVHTITFKISGIHRGTYLLRIQVDGAESPLTVDSSGKYVNPQVAVI